ncbi:MAG: hypothetical protein WCB58_06205 [Acidobacteriaceae bacterium]
MFVSRPWGVFASLTAASTLALSLAQARAQEVATDAGLPDAPVQQISTSQTPATPQAPQPAAQKNAASQSSDDVLRQEEKQRAFGVMPMFQTVSLANSKNIPPLRPKQKFHLMLKSSTDPFVFAQDAVLSGIGQARNTNSGTTVTVNPDGTKTYTRWGFGQGAAGYFKRFGASYADTADGNFWGNAVLPVLLKEDPRYYRMGDGSFSKRFLYSAKTAVWCRRDNGTWGPNYANVAGNFVSGGISNLYYPSQEGGFEKTTIGALTVTAEGMIGSELIEFLPDIEHHFLKNRRPKP